ncbi:MAG: aldo/keto reductase [Nocardioides sp.]
MTHLPAAAAGTWKLGDRTVNRLGFGAMRLTGTGGMGRGRDRDPDASAEVVRRAVELGVDHLDTAGFYFSDSCRANDVIRAALAPYPDGLTIATKVGPGRDLDTGEWGDWVGPDQLRRHVEYNLASLGLDRLHVVNYRSNGRDDVPAAVGALAALEDEGLLEHVGLSNVGPEALAEARQVTDVVCVQNRHALGYERSDTDDVLAACREAGTAFVPFFSIAAQAREGTAEESHDVVGEIAATRDVAGPGADRVDARPGAARAGHPRHRRRRAPRAERRRRLAPALRRRAAARVGKRRRHDGNGVNRTRSPFGDGAG